MTSATLRKLIGLHGNDSNFVVAGDDMLDAGLDPLSCSWSPTSLFLPGVNRTGFEFDPNVPGVYSVAASPSSLSLPPPQLTTGPFLLGVNLAGAEFTPEHAPGVYGVDYPYPTHQEVDYFASQGLSVIRLPFLWERLQHTQNGPFDVAELGRLDDVVNYATGKGLKVEIDPHNFGYGFGALIGSAQTPNSSFADFWSKLALHFKDNSEVIFGLMNEPYDQSASVWLTSANAAIAAIRATGATQEILVPGTAWTGAWTWTTTSGNAAVFQSGVQDPLNNYALEVHQYLDSDGSGTHENVVSATIGVERVTAVTQWAETTGHRLFLGEVGVSSDPTSLTALNGMLIYIQQHLDVWQGVAYWAAGPWWGDYKYSIEPDNGVDKPQMTILLQHLLSGGPILGTGGPDPLSGADDADIIRGLGGNDTILAAGGNDTIDGGPGADAMTGGTGDDFFYVDNALDVVNEAVGGGNDRVFASVSYTLGVGQQVEKLTTTRNNGTGGINLTGNALANIVYGNAGANSLDGKGGADNLNGLGGDDLYYVDNALDVVNEAVGSGNDRVFASVSYMLKAGQSVEKLTTDNDLGISAINLTGNEFANLIYGNNGANTLDGKGGADNLVGLGGDDFYVVDNALDDITEAVGSGNDRVFASVSYTLKAGQSVEKLSTSSHVGTGSINLTGNELANIIFGNNGANSIDGKGGGDTLYGLGGNDFYLVDNALDVVHEAAGGGNDRVFASVSYALNVGQSVEKLTTNSNTGTGAINLTGNELANSIYGNAGANIIDGGLGNDSLTGLGGHDHFRFDTRLNATTNVDTISDFTVSTGAAAETDKIDLAHAIFSTLGTGALASSAFTTSAPTNSGQHIVYNTVTGALSYDNDGNGPHGAVLFALLNTHPVLSAADFLIIV